MKKVFYLMLLCLWTATSANAQLTIGLDQVPHPAAGLDLSPVSAMERGLLLPRVELKSDPAIFVLRTDNAAVDVQTAQGMLVYNTAGVQDGPGVYVWNGSRWSLVNAPAATGTTSDCSFVMDVDGNVYQARQFGSQCWMTSNLRTTRTKSGALLQSVRTNSAYFNLNPGAGAVAWENNRVTYHTETSATVNALFSVNDVVYDWDYNAFANQYGFYYKQAEAKTACPEGWKLPANDDFNTLVTTLGTDAGKKMKANNYKYSSNPTSRVKQLDNSQIFTGAWGGYVSSDPRNAGFLALPGGAVSMTAANSGLIGDKNSNTAVGSISIAPAGGNGFAKFAYWWTSNDNIAKKLDAASDELTSASTTASDLVGVRCIKE
ncbi:hypothetical protein FACS189413_10930 [Bacteroidia bacterium]|nr:hypothetical protein FACS189413_10930 [Bacteroidia bacterium]